MASNIETANSTQTAEMLGVSPEYLVRLLNTGKIPFEMVGTRKVVRAFDVEVYLARRAKCRAALDELSRLREEFETPPA